MPVQPRTVAQQNVRTNQATNSAAWRALTDAQREGWGSLGSLITRSDSLGQSYNLTGFQAYCSVNNTLLVAGSAVVGDAPVLSTPGGIVTMTLTLTHAAFSVAFTATPLPANVKLIVRASPQRSAGRSFEGDFRIVFVGAAATASPANILAAYTAKFGAHVTGNRIFVQASTTLNGFESRPFSAAQVVG